MRREEINSMDADAADLRGAIVSWEKLRIAYNLVLGVGVCVFWGVAHVHAAWQLVPLVIVIANACYCLGPLLEIVLYVFLRWRMGRSRYACFAAGLAATLALLWCYGAMVS